MLLLVLVRVFLAVNVGLNVEQKPYPRSHEYGDF